MPYICTAFQRKCRINTFKRKFGWVAETTSLLNWRTGNRTGGSNPPASAKALQVSCKAFVLYMPKSKIIYTKIRIQFIPKLFLIYAMHFWGLFLLKEMLKYGNYSIHVKITHKSASMEFSSWGRYIALTRKNFFSHEEKISSSSGFPY